MFTDLRPVSNSLRVGLVLLQNNEKMTEGEESQVGWKKKKKKKKWECISWFKKRVFLWPQTTAKVNFLHIIDKKSRLLLNLLSELCSVDSCCCSIRRQTLTSLIYHMKDGAVSLLSTRINIHAKVLWLLQSYLSEATLRLEKSYTKYQRLCGTTADRSQSAAGHQIFTSAS